MNRDRGFAGAPDIDVADNQNRDGELFSTDAVRAYAYRGKVNEA